MTHLGDLSNADILEQFSGIDVAVGNLRLGEEISMPKFARIFAMALGLTCAIWSTSASAISVPIASRTVSAAPLTVESVALICRERCGYYGCRQICVHRPGFYGMYGPGSYAYGWHEYAGDPWRGRWWHRHEHEDEHWGRYEHEREYENED